MKIYRLENNLGKGPFHTGCLMRIQLVGHLTPAEMLDDMDMTFGEFSEFVSDGAIFGWKTKRLMKSFFKIKDSAIAEAKKSNFKISIYEVKRSAKIIQFPDGQVLFKRPLERPVKVTLEEFFAN